MATGTRMPVYGAVPNAADDGLEREGGIDVYKVVLSGAGFLADAYDLFVVNRVQAYIEEEYGAATPAERALLSASTLWPAIVGQLSCGFLADQFGRKTMFIITVCLITIGSLMSALYFGNAGSVYIWVPVCRIVMGLGIGGEYPLSASVASESVSPRLRGRMLAIIFAGQGCGALLATLVFFICNAAGASAGFTWRFALAFGTIPTIVAAILRAFMKETREFVRAHSLEEEEHTPHWMVLLSALKAYKWAILGTALSWFLLDVSFYGNSLFSSEIGKVLGLGTSLDAKTRVSLYIALMALPGYFLTIFLINVVGRHSLQFYGFIGLGVLFALLAGLFPFLRQAPLAFLLSYGLTFLLSNFGPNATTYIIPGELYPVSVKATCHGFSAASGKLGAAVGAMVFAPLTDPHLPASVEETNIQWIMAACAITGGLGALCTFLLVPKYTPESLANLQSEFAGEQEKSLSQLKAKNKKTGGTAEL